MYRILLLCRDGIRLVCDSLGTRWEYVWRWHTWTIEDNHNDAAEEAVKLRIDLNSMIARLRIIGVDETY